MRKIAKIFLALGFAFSVGAVLFFIQIVRGGANVGEIIVYPIYSAFSAIAAAFSLVVGLLLCLLSRK